MPQKMLHYARRKNCMDKKRVESLWLHVEKSCQWSWIQKTECRNLRVHLGQYHGKSVFPYVCRWHIDYETLYALDRMGQVRAYSLLYNKYRENAQHILEVKFNGTGRKSDTYPRIPLPQSTWKFKNAQFKNCEETNAAGSEMGKWTR